MSDTSNKQNPVIGTSDMPPAQTLKYETYYKVNQVFLNDLRTVLQDSPYAEVKKFLDFLHNYNYILPAAMLNEFLNRLAYMPYKTVSPIMVVIENKDLFPKYFEDVTAQVTKPINQPQKQ